MRGFLTILSFLLISTAVVAQPVIDHMVIDENKGQLQIFGSFGQTQGKVWVDSVELVISNWSDSLIIATIPDSGRGAAGVVIINDNGYNSEPGIITLWGANIRYHSHVSHSQNIENTYSEYNLFWRLDINSILKKREFSFPYHFYGMKFSNTTQSHIWETSEYASDSSYPFEGWVDLSKKEFRFNISLLVPDYLSNPIQVCPFDSSLSIIATDTIVNIIPGGVFWEQHSKETRYLFHPTNRISSAVNSNKPQPINVYPNPSSDKLHIHFQTDQSEATTIKLFDILGRQVRSVTIGAGEQNATIRTADLGTGNYILTVQVGSEYRSRIVSVLGF